MKRALLAVIAIVSAACSTGGAVPPPGGTVPAEASGSDVPVREVVQVVKQALLDTSQSLKGLPPLKSVTLTLTTSVERKSAGISSSS